MHACTCVCVCASALVGVWLRALVCLFVLLMFRVCAPCSPPPPHTHTHAHALTHQLQEELRCVLAVVRHGDRTPKQKMKMRVNQVGGWVGGPALHPLPCTPYLDPLPWIFLFSFLIMV